MKRIKKQFLSRHGSLIVILNKIVCMNLTSKIDFCRKCFDSEFSNRLNFVEKPFVKFQVEEIWKPEQVKVLFVAESPPWNGKQSYFYNQNQGDNRTNLRKEVLSLLNLKSLEEFKTKGYYLIDVIKCRLNKKVKKNIPKEAITTCSHQFLEKEIKQLKPKKIFVLGNTAKKALQITPKFKELTYHKVTDNYEAALSGHQIILSAYPGGQTRKYQNKIKEAFAKLK